MLLLTNRHYYASAKDAKCMCHGNLPVIGISWYLHTEFGLLTE